MAPSVEQAILRSLVVVCIFITFWQRSAAKSQTRPNIILCMADDLGWGDVGYNGHPHLKTPYLDQLAADGTRFDRFYAASPVCSPTRGSCVTGRHPSRYEIPFAMAGHIKPQELTLYEALRGVGYRTGHFGKWHLGTLTPKMGAQNRWGVWSRQPAEHYSPPWENGVDVCFVTESKVPTWNPRLVPPRMLKDPGGRENRLFGNDYFLGPNRIEQENLSGDDSRVIVDRVEPFIRQAVAQQTPFLAVVWFHAPHSPVVAGPEYLSLYSDRPEHEAHYYGCVTAMDEQIGRLRSLLAELGVADDTILFFTSDNGPARQGSDRHVGSAGSLRGFKLSLWEGGIRVPGIMVWPRRFSQPRVVKAPVCTSDYVPTIFEALDLAPDNQPMPLDGVSILPLVEGRIAERPQPIAFQSRQQAALVGDQYKLLTRNDGATWQLYDLLQDPGEMNDLAATEPAIVESMRQALVDWQESCRRSSRGADY